MHRGLPAYHPYVIAQHYDPVDVDKELRNDTAALVKAGFNVYGKIPSDHQVLFTY